MCTPEPAHHQQGESEHHPIAPQSQPHLMHQQVTASSDGQHTHGVAGVSQDAHLDAGPCLALNTVVTWVQPGGRRGRGRCTLDVTRKLRHAHWLWPQAPSPCGKKRPLPCCTKLVCIAARHWHSKSKTHDCMGLREGMAATDSPLHCVGQSDAPPLPHVPRGKCASGHSADMRHTTGNGVAREDGGCGRDVCDDTYTVPSGSVTTSPRLMFAMRDAGVLTPAAFSAGL